MPPLVIDRFDGSWRFLSNFHRAPLIYDGKCWPTLEHAFQAAKTDIVTEKMAIFYAAGPADAKELGRKATKRPDWDKVRAQVMLNLLRIKFQTPYLHQQLFETGPYTLLVEGNHWHDNDWGACFCHECVPKPKLNMLGQLLMQVRAEIYTEISAP